MTESFAQGTEFSLDSYTSMRDDGARTPAFVEAIKRRLAGREGELSVVDVGTGPFALLAIAAAKAGARQVYAIEADPGVARLAREAIAASGLPEGRIQVRALPQAHVLEENWEWAHETVRGITW